MANGISIRLNPRTKEYEAHDSTKAKDSLVATFPDYKAAFHFYKKYCGSIDMPINKRKRDK